MAHPSDESTRAWLRRNVEIVGEEPGILLFMLAVVVFLLFGPGGPLVPGG